MEADEASGKDGCNQRAALQLKRLQSGKGL